MSGCDPACCSRYDPYRAPFGGCGPVVLHCHADEVAAAPTVAGKGVDPVQVPAWTEGPRHRRHLGTIGLFHLLVHLGRRDALQEFQVLHCGQPGQRGTANEVTTCH